MADEDAEGVGLPQKGLNMIIKDALPDMRIANETRELLNQCCVEFVKHISREAQLISSKDQRKTIYHDHVQKALKNLGFPREYVDAANSVLGECKIAAEKRLKRKNSRLDKCGIPEDQLWLMQQQLIEQARRNEAEKQQQMAAQGQFGYFGGGSIDGGGDGEFHQVQLQQMAAAAQFDASQSCQQQQQLTVPQFIAPLAPASAHLPTAGPSTSTSSASLPPMMMPFGLNPQQLIVPSTSSAPQFGGLAMDPNVAAATAQLFFQQSFGSQSDGAGQKREGGDEEEEEEEDYDAE